MNKITQPEMPAVHALEFGEDEITDVTQRARDSEVAPPAQRFRRGALVVLRGLDTGRMVLLLEDALTIGRDRTAEIHFEDKGLSRQHARISKENGHYFIEDLDSRNGTYVDGARIVRTELRDGARIVMSANVIFRFNMVDDVEERVTKQLFEASTRDALTGIYNRRYLDERLAAEVSFAHRHKVMLGFLLFDIDHFKNINDTYGHLAGDAVLAAMGRRIQGLIRVEDVLARYGGEELALIARGVGMDGLKILGERVRRGVSEAITMYEGTPIHATVSVGVASLQECDAHATGDLLVALADERLYRAKHEGRNRVCCE